MQLCVTVREHRAHPCLTSRIASPRIPLACHLLFPKLTGHTCYSQGLLTWSPRLTARRGKTVNSKFMTNTFLWRWERLYGKMPGQQWPVDSQGRRATLNPWLSRLLGKWTLGEQSLTMHCTWALTTGESSWGVSRSALQQLGFRKAPLVVSECPFFPFH